MRHQSRGFRSPISKPRWIPSSTVSCGTGSTRTRFSGQKGVCRRLRSMPGTACRDRQTSSARRSRSDRVWTKCKPGPRGSAVSLRRKLTLQLAPCLSSATPRPGCCCRSLPHEPAMLRAIAALMVLLWAHGAGAMTIERVTSPAGIQAWLVEDHTLPVVTMRFAFPGGAVLDPPGKGGLAAMVAGLLDEGAGPYDTAAVKTRLEDLARELGFETGRGELGGSKPSV